MGVRGVGAGLRKDAERELAKLKKPPAEPWKEVGLRRSERVIKFLQDLPITKGPLAGKKMQLLPEQLAFVREIYGNLDGKRLRKRRIGIKSEPKGNGKTGLIAGLCLSHLLGPESEQRGEIYSAAIDRQQAGLIFAEMEAIIIRDLRFKVRVNIQRFHKRMEVLKGEGEGSTYEALSADARRAHGLSPSLFAYDELAQAKDRVLLDNLINGLGKRKQALGLIISTQAPDDEHPLSQLIDDGLAGTDPSIYVQLTAAPNEADPFKEETWLACNPALGKFLSLEEMRTAAERARRIPAFEPAFRNLRLNQRVDANVESRIVPITVWKQGDVPVNPERLAGRRCYVGLDLSGKHDLTAMVAVFPDDEVEPGFDVLAWFWTPDGQMDARRPSERDLFRTWIKAGLLTAVPGPTIRYRFVAEQLAELQRRFELVAVGYDRWRIDDLRQDLEDVGTEIPLQEFGQGFKDMGPAVEYFAEMALTGKLRHGGHPVLTACVANAVLVSDPAGNQKIDKDKSNQRATVRIDGAVALTMALGTARRFAAETPALDVMAMVA